MRLIEEGVLDGHDYYNHGYLVRVHVKKDGSLSWERVHMNYTKK